MKAKNKRCQTCTTKCCGHHCPCCRNPAYPLGGFCRRSIPSCEHGYLSPCGKEMDAPWRVKLNRVAHKCYGNQHRFDVKDNDSLANYQVKEPNGSVVTIAAGECNYTEQLWHLQKMQLWHQKQKSGKR